MADFTSLIHGGLNDLRKGKGPFIGPRGGKWADAKHTIAWKEGKPAGKQRKHAHGGSSGGWHNDHKNTTADQHQKLQSKHQDLATQVNHKMSQQVKDSNSWFAHKYERDYHMHMADAHGSAKAGLAYGKEPGTMDRVDKRRVDGYLAQARRAKRDHVDAVKDVERDSAPPNPKEYPKIKGMDGPSKYRSGRVLYYDRKEGAYYDSKSDMYLSEKEASKVTAKKASTTFSDLAKGKPTKYLKRKRGKGGRYEYTYAEDGKPKKKKGRFGNLLSTLMGVVKKHPYALMGEFKSMVRDFDLDELIEMRSEIKDALEAKPEKKAPGEKKAPKKETAEKKKPAPKKGPSEKDILRQMLKAIDKMIAKKQEANSKLSLRSLVAGYHKGDTEAIKELYKRAQELLPGIRISDALNVVATAAENYGKLPKEFVDEMIRENRVKGKKPPAAGTGASGDAAATLKRLAEGKLRTSKTYETMPGDPNHNFRDSQKMLAQSEIYNAAQQGMEMAEKVAERWRKRFNNKKYKDGLGGNSALRSVDDAIKIARNTLGEKVEPPAAATEEAPKPAAKYERSKWADFKSQMASSDGGAKLNRQYAEFAKNALKATSKKDLKHAIEQAKAASRKDDTVVTRTGVGRSAGIKDKLKRLQAHLENKLKLVEKYGEGALAKESEKNELAKRVAAKKQAEAKEGGLQVGEKPARPLQRTAALGYLNKLREKHGDGTAANIDAQVEAVKDGWISGAAIVGSGFKNPKKSALKWLAEKKAELNKPKPALSEKQQKLETNRRAKVEKLAGAATKEASNKATVLKPGDVKRKEHKTGEKAHKRAKKFQSTDSLNRASMTQSVVMNLRGERYMVSTDGSRLAMIPVSKDVKEETSYGEANIGYGAFPDVARVIPSTDQIEAHQTHHFDAKAMLAQAKLAAYAPDRQSGKVHFFQKDGKHSVQASTSWGDAPEGEEIQAMHGTAHAEAGGVERAPEIQTDTKRAAINAKFIVDALQGATGSVAVHYEGSDQALHITRSDGEVHIIMPMRLDTGELPQDHPHNPRASKSFTNFSDLFKAKPTKYKTRKRGKDGRWVYTYAEKKAPKSRMGAFLNKIVGFFSEHHDKEDNLVAAEKKLIYDLETPQLEMLRDAIKAELAAMEKKPVPGAKKKKPSKKRSGAPVTAEKKGPSRKQILQQLLAKIDGELAARAIVGYAPTESEDNFETMADEESLGYRRAREVMAMTVSDASRLASEEPGTPLRAPHHTTSTQGLLGELDQAQGGILFLDQIEDFSLESIKKLAVAMRDNPYVMIGYRTTGTGTETDKVKLKARLEALGVSEDNFETMPEPVTFEQRVRTVESFDDYKSLYEATLSQMLGYKPGEAGSKVFAEKLGLLTDTYPEFDSQYDAEKDAEATTPVSQAHEENRMDAELRSNNTSEQKANENIFTYAENALDPDSLKFVIEWSESGAVEDGQEFASVNELNAKLQEISDHHRERYGLGGGYFKTRVYAELEGQRFFGNRLDVTSGGEDVNLVDHMTAISHYYQSDRGREYWSAVQANQRDRGEETGEQAHERAQSYKNMVQLVRDHQRIASGYDIAGGDPPQVKSKRELDKLSETRRAQADAWEQAGREAEQRAAQDAHAARTAGWEAPQSRREVTKRVKRAIVRATGLPAKDVSVRGSTGTGWGWIRISGKTQAAQAAIDAFQGRTYWGNISPDDWDSATLEFEIGAGIHTPGSISRGGFTNFSDLLKSTGRA